MQKSSRVFCMNCEYFSLFLPHCIEIILFWPIKMWQTHMLSSEERLTAFIMRVGNWSNEKFSRKHCAVLEVGITDAWIFQFNAVKPPVFRNAALSLLPVTQIVLCGGICFAMNNLRFPVNFTLRSQGEMWWNKLASHCWQDSVWRLWFAVILWLFK